ncbi:MAG: RDD family protein [Xanthomonadales bacterium]|nr:RDD family protein [Xanthomonadales bacterium]
MDNSAYALVLSGTILPGHAPDEVWPKLARYLRIEAAKLDQLRARAPLTIKRSDDLGKLQALQDGMGEAGAHAELCATDGRPPLFVLFDGTASGPLPRIYVEERIGHGLWPESVRVAEVGSNAWRAWREFSPPPPPPPAPVEESHELPVEPVTWASKEPQAPAAALAAAVLPPGAAVNAGFWRRCAAFVMDSIILGVVAMLLQVLMLGSMAPTPDALLAQLATAVMLCAALFVGQWLYFALFECSVLQATPGKLAMGLKVADQGGCRIGFGRASGRYFGKILSSVVLNIGFALAGWTARKQALHDMLAGTLVVFRGVHPDRPRPTVRPPMPWYGWLVNVLFVLGILASLTAAAISIMILGEIAGGALRGGSGF